jgi:hypothetical protein
MEEHTSTDLKILLQNLSESLLDYKRYNAAVKLGELTESSEEIVRILAVAAALDRDADVRSVAMQALQSPVHQAFLKDHPDLIQEATHSAMEGRERERRAEEQKINGEFLRRRTRARIHSMALLGSPFVFSILIVVGLDQGWVDRSSFCVWQFVFIAFVILIALIARRNWRCPACESQLTRPGFTINPMMSPDIVHCPQCGKRLL